MNQHVQPENLGVESDKETITQSEDEESQHDDKVEEMYREGECNLMSTMMLLMSASETNGKWAIVDSGSTHNLINDSTLINACKRSDIPLRVQVGN